MSFTTKVSCCCFAAIASIFLDVSTYAQEPGIEWVRQPLECDYRVTTKAELDPGSGREILRDEDEVNGGLELGALTSSSVYIGEALANMEAHIAVAPSDDNSAMSVSGGANGGINTTWPDQFGGIGFSNSATVVYQFETTNVDPAATFTLSAKIDYSISGVVQQQSGGTFEIIPGRDPEGPSVLTMDVMQDFVEVQAPSGTYNANLTGGKYSFGWETIATDVKDGDFFTLDGGQDGHVPLGPQNATGAGHWKIFVRTTQNP